MTVSTFMTADELLEIRDDGCKYELVNGELRKTSPSGLWHSRIALEIATSLSHHVKQKHAGEVVGADAGFRLSRNPDTVLAPDAAFIRAERFVDAAGFFEGAPDVAFEVVSPGDRYSEIELKIGMYLRYETPVVVIVDPQSKRARIHRPSGTTNVTDAIELPDVLPGWKLPLSDLFD